MKKIIFYPDSKMASQEMASQSRGNTKARDWQLTLNEKNLIKDLIENLQSYKTLTYLAVSPLEVAPTTGHEHYHIFAHFNNLIKLSTKKTLGAHIEKCRGSIKDNIEYLTKTGPLSFEWGERPHQGVKTIKELKEMKIDEVPPNYYRIKKQIDSEEKDKNSFFEMLNEIENNELKAPEIIYITGPSGSGKTYSAYKLALEKFEKNEIGKITLKNDFFDIINEEAKCFIIEEFRPSQIKASDFLQLTDKYGYRANIKGGFVSLRPKCIIICSIIPPEEIYHDEMNLQFIRRITKRINLDTPNDIELD